MVARAASLTCLIWFAAFGGANAQDSNSSSLDTSGRCFYGSKSFAPASPILIGDATYYCGGDLLSPKWIKTDARVSVNCLYDDSYYAPGSIVSIAAKKSAIICRATGIWEQVASQ